MKHPHPFLTVLPLLWLAPLAGLTAAANPKPNIIFILADDLGYMDIGANNPKTFYETPHIDALAAKGMRFKQGYAACPVCSPARAIILTGLLEEAERAKRGRSVKRELKVPCSAGPAAVSSFGDYRSSSKERTNSRPAWRP